MTAQVIFLNTGYFPDKDESEHLEQMQEFLTYTHHQFEYELRGIPLDEMRRRKNAAHKCARERLHIVKRVDG